MAVRELKGLGGDRLSFDFPEVRLDLINQYLRWQNFRRAGFRVASKRRSDLSYSNRKLWRQKGTGRARIGDRTAGHLKHGAKAHGPVKRRTLIHLNKKVRRRALISCLSMKWMDISFGDFKTDWLKSSEMKLWCRENGLPITKILLVVEENFKDRKVQSNFKSFRILPWRALNVRDLMASSRVIFQRGLIENFVDEVKIGQ